MARRPKGVDMILVHKDLVKKFADRIIEAADDLHSHQPIKTFPTKCQCCDGDDYVRHILAFHAHKAEVPEPRTLLALFGRHVSLDPKP